MDFSPPSGLPPWRRPHQPATGHQSHRDTKLAGLGRAISWSGNPQTTGESLRADYRQSARVALTGHSALIQHRPRWLPGDPTPRSAAGPALLTMLAVKGMATNRSPQDHSRIRRYAHDSS